MNDKLTTKEFDIIMEGDIEVINENSIKLKGVSTMHVATNPSQG